MVNTRRRKRDQCGANQELDDENGRLDRKQPESSGTMKFNHKNKDQGHDSKLEHEQKIESMSLDLIKSELELTKLIANQEVNKYKRRCNEFEELVLRLEKDLKISRERETKDQERINNLLTKLERNEKDSSEKLVELKMQLLDLERVIETMKNLHGQQESSSSEEKELHVPSKAVINTPTNEAKRVQKEIPKNLTVLSKSCSRPMTRLKTLDSRHTLTTVNPTISSCTETQKLDVSELPSPKKQVKELVSTSDSDPSPASDPTFASESDSDPDYDPDSDTYPTPAFDFISQTKSFNATEVERKMSDDALEEEVNPVEEVPNSDTKTQSYKTDLGREEKNGEEDDTDEDAFNAKNPSNSSCSEIKAAKRKRLRGREALTCHQCKKKDKGRLIHCTLCGRKRYCISCSTRWYPLLTEDELAKKCPVCRNNCNCKACLCRKGTKNSVEKKPTTTEKLRHNWYILTKLLPWLVDFYKDQMLEKEIEAKIQGVVPSQFKVKQASCNSGQHAYCNNCKTSIVDFHRSCPSCSYDLCLYCCREIREGILPGGYGKQLPQYDDLGFNCLYGAGRQLPQYNLLKNSKDLPKPIKEWIANNDGGICCPSDSCGSTLLELRCFIEEEATQELLAKASALVGSRELTKKSNLTISCSCNSNMQLKAACREGSDDNYLFYSNARGVKGQLEHFQKHWSKGVPVIVRDVLEMTSGLSWEPLVMCRALRETKPTSKTEKNEVNAINCLNWCPVKINIYQLFRRYMDGGFDKDGWPEMLQLEDWPSTTTFADGLQRHDAEFINALPFQEYTHPQFGILNLAAKLHNNVGKRDLGPKYYIANGFYEELGRGDSVIRLHCDMSDAVNILMHTAEVAPSINQLRTIDWMKKKHREQDIKEKCGIGSIFLTSKSNGFDGNGAHNPEEDTSFAADDTNVSKCSNIQTIDHSRSKKVEEKEEKEEKKRYDARKYPEAGALWDIFRREDVPKLEDYVRKHCREFRYLYCNPVDQVSHPIHDQSFYLSSEHKKKLKKEYGIEPWTFEQKIGEAVFIPAGCPYQIRNLKSCIKVALNFVSPENILECMRLTKEFRVLPPNHRAKPDKLEVMKIALHALTQAVNDME